MPSFLFCLLLLRLSSVLFLSGFRCSGTPVLFPFFHCLGKPDWDCWQQQSSSGFDEDVECQSAGATAEGRKQGGGGGGLWCIWRKGGWGKEGQAFEVAAA